MFYYADNEIILKYNNEDGENDNLFYLKQIILELEHIDNIKLKL